MFFQASSYFRIEEVCIDVFGHLVSNSVHYNLTPGLDPWETAIQYRQLCFARKERVFFYMYLYIYIYIYTYQLSVPTPFCPHTHIHTRTLTHTHTYTFPHVRRFSGRGFTPGSLVLARADSPQFPLSKVPEHPPLISLVAARLGLSNIFERHQALWKCAETFADKAKNP